MRANLVFHRIPEIINEDAPDSDQYTKVKHQVATYISEHLELDKETVLNTIVRAHRSRQKKHVLPRKTPRSIFVKFDRDDTAAMYLQKFIKINISKGRPEHFVEQQFTKELQERRNKHINKERT